MAGSSLEAVKDSDGEPPLQRRGPRARHSAYSASVVLPALEPRSPRRQFPLEHLANAVELGGRRDRVHLDQESFDCGNPFG